MSAGYVEEATAWRDWLLRAVAGDPDDLQIMYGVPASAASPSASCRGCRATRARRRCASATPRIEQFQLDVYGEVIDALYQTRRAGVDDDPNAVGGAARRSSSSSRAAGSDPDEGIWEVRGPRQHFTHSKVMAWVAFDRAVKGVEEFGLEGAASTAGRQLRDEIHDEVCEQGFDADRNTFTQAYGSKSPRRRAADDAARRLPARDRPARARARSPRSSAS